MRRRRFNFVSLTEGRQRLLTPVLDGAAEMLSRAEKVEIVLEAFHFGASSASTLLHSATLSQAIACDTCALMSINSLDGHTAWRA